MSFNIRDYKKSIGCAFDFNVVKREVGIKRYLTERAIEIQNRNRFNATWRGGDSLSCSISDDGAKWCDHRDKTGGSVLDLAVRVEGLGSIQEAARVLGERFNVPKKEKSGGASGWREVVVHTYRDEAGLPLYCKVRYEREKDGKRDKSFCYYQFNHDGSRGAKGLGKNKHVLYRLPEVIQAVRDGSVLLIVEGEKDVDTLASLGFAATSSKEWARNGERFAAYFREAKQVLIVADNDVRYSGHSKGEQIACEVRDALAAVGVTAPITYTPSGKDATDYAAELRKDGLSDDAIRQKFIDLAASPPPWTWTAAQRPANGAVIPSDDADEMPARFGEIAPGSDADYPTLIGKVMMPDGRYYGFDITAKDTELAAAINGAKKEVVGRLLEAHGSERHFSVKQSDLREVVPLATVMWLRSRGRLFRNAETRRVSDLLYFDNKSGRCLRLRSDEFVTWLSNGARLNREDNEFKRLVAFVEDCGMSEDAATETVPSAFVARRGDAVYISCGESRIVRCRDGKCELVRNGCDGVLFQSEHTLRPWQLLPDERQVRDPFQTLAQFRDLAYHSWYGPYLLRCWLLNLFACSENRVPLLLAGERGSGKSSVARALREVLGYPERETEVNAQREDDFWAACNRHGVLIFDNIEEEATAAKWFTSALERVSTGGTREVRQLYTHGTMQYRPNSHIILSSKRPLYAANEGVSHRLVIVELDADIAEFRGNETLKKEVLDRRDEAMSWAARTVAKALAAMVDVPKNVNERFPAFAEFSLKCAAVLDDYDNTLKALQCGEFAKSRIALVNDPEANDLYQFLVEHDGAWEGELMEVAKWSNGDAMPDGDGEKHKEFLRKKAMRYAAAIKRHRRPFEVCFKTVTTRTLNGRRLYNFGGLNDLLKGNL